MCTFDDQFMYVKDNIVLYPDCKIVFYKEINPYTLPFKVSFNWHQLKKIMFLKNYLMLTKAALK